MGRWSVVCVWRFLILVNLGVLIVEKGRRVVIECGFKENGSVLG